MLKLIQRLTSKQNKKINKKIYSLSLGRKVVSLVNLGTATTLHSN